MVSSRYLIAPLALAAIGIATVPSTPVAAQEVTSRPVVQPLPAREVEDLRQALRALDRAPRDVEALLNAGFASIKVNDLEAAMGYFGRAEEAAPGDQRVKQAQASVFLRSGRPVEALRLFSEAEAAGASGGRFLSDRGLSYDMVGDQVRAQAYYREALRISPGDSETVRRMAISQAIAGNEPAFLDTLRPLVDRQDFPAFRAQAFGLAILGENDRAKDVTEAVMPSDLARRIVPYLGYMPRLTKAQQAAAANLGIFPKAADIGREDPQIAAYVNQSVAPASSVVIARGADNRLEPAGEPLGRQAQAAAPAPVGAPVRTAPAPTATVPAATAAPVIARAPEQTPQAAPGFNLSASATPASTESTETVQVARVSPVVTPPVSATVPQVQPRPQPKPDPDFASAFADLGRPDTRDVTKSGDAVDIASIEIPREARPKPAPKPEPKPAPKAPAHPQRFWVQLGTGKDASLFKFDWTRLSGKAGGDLAGLSGHFVPFGESFILLAGPVKNKAAMDELVGKLTEKGLGVLPYTSSEGQEVQKLK